MDNAVGGSGLWDGRGGGPAEGEIFEGMKKL